MKLSSNSSHIYSTTRVLEGPQNNQFVLLAWSTSLFSQKADAPSPQLTILQEWASSENGRSLYDHIVRTAQDSQSLEQFSLVMAAMLGYSRLVPDSNDDSDRPFKGSYLTDLDAHFGGRALGNRGRVAEHMVMALIRVLSTVGDKYGKIVTFLVAVLDREPSLLHGLDGLSDQYLGLRVLDHDHKEALHHVMTETWRSQSDLMYVLLYLASP
jgi:hypothetical protein